MNIPSIKECKTLEDLHNQTALIAKQATDLVSDDLVQTGYMMSGQVPATVYINISSMAKKRLKAMFPTANFSEPLFDRLYAEARLIAAECIHLKYECRVRRQPYDHLKDCTIRIKKLVRDRFEEYANTILKLTHEEDS